MVLEEKLWASSSTELVKKLLKVLAFSGTQEPVADQIQGTGFITGSLISTGRKGPTETMGTRQFVIGGRQFITGESIRGG